MYKIEKEVSLGFGLLRFSHRVLASAGETMVAFCLFALFQKNGYISGKKLFTQFFFFM